MTEVRIVGYDVDELAIDVLVPTGKLGTARTLAQVPETTSPLGAYPLSEAAARQIADVPPGLSYFLEVTSA